jgi:hypothetical protein
VARQLRVEQASLEDAFIALTGQHAAAGHISATDYRAGQN